MLVMGRALAFLMLLCLFLAQGCRKDSLQSKTNEIENQLIKEDVIDNWIKNNPASKYLNLDWSKARQAVIDGKQVVRIPLLPPSKNTTAKLGLSSTLNQAKLSTVSPGIGVAGKTAANNTNDNNTNYNRLHAPEVFFIQEGNNEKLHTFLINFVPTDTESGQGEDGMWTGKLYEWNVTADTIFVQKVVRNHLMEKYLLKYSGNSPEMIESLPKITKLQSLGGLGDRKTSNMLTWILDKLEDAIGWLGSLFGLSYWGGSNIYGQIAEDAGYRINPINWKFLTGGGSGQGSGGYAGAGMGVYGAYAPGYLGNSSLGLSYGYSNPQNIIYTDYPGHYHGPNVPPLAPGDIILTDLGITDPILVSFLTTTEVGVTLQYTLKEYLDTNEWTPENKEFCIWAVGYLNENPNSFNQAFKDLLNGIYNEYSPIYIPANFDIIYPQEYFDTEDSYDALTLELMQAGVNNTDPIPEAYYKYGTRIDMAGATPLNGRRTALGFPSNHRYFWKELVKLRPEMFDEANRTRILNGGSPVANDRWIKYNPTHKAYKDLPLRHHHEGQGRYAFAIPEKVHQKWDKILHTIKAGKFPKLRGTMNSLAGGMQIFSLLTDFNTGNPDAWLNWYGATDEVGKVYKQPFTGDYFVITKQTKYRNSSGEVIRAKVTYDVYADYIWDQDEKKYMGVLKLGTFTEDIDMNNRWSTNPVWEPKML